jgi:hypothetical protein
LNEALAAAEPLLLTAALTVAATPIVSTLTRYFVINYFTNNPPATPQIGYHPDDLADVAMWATDQVQLLVAALATPFIGLLFEPGATSPLALVLSFIVLTLAILAVWAKVATSASPSQYIDTWRVGRIGRRTIPLISDISYVTAFTGALLCALAGFAAVLAKPPHH